MALITKTPQQSLIDDFYKLEVISHLAHVNTRSYSAHLAFGDFYDKVGDFKDFLVEYLMGEGKLNKLSLPAITTDGDAETMADEVCKSFCDFAHKVGDEALINKAGEFEEVVAHLHYMLMLK